MKRKYYSLLLASCFIVVACTEKETPGGIDEPTVKVVVTTGEATDIDPTSVKLNGTANITYANDANGTAFFYYSLDQSDAKGLVKSGARVSVGSISNSDSVFNETITNLTPETKYYYMASVSIDEKEFNGAVRSFITAEKPKELSVTGAATDITEFKAKLSGYANLTPDLGNVTMGILYSTEENPTLDNGVELTSKELDGNNMYTVQAKDLKYNTVYYYKSFVQYGGVYRFGAVKSFTTRDFTVTIRVASATDISDTKATLSGSLEVDSIEEIRRGTIVFIYGTVSGLEELIIKGVQIAAYEEDETFFCNLRGLMPETTYYYSVGVKVHDKVCYGEVKRFDTKRLELAEVADLGLSVKWRGWNLGANAPEEYGDYYAWGETIPKRVYSWRTYKWCNGSLEFYEFFTKYNDDSSKGNVDKKITLEAEDDVACVKLGGKWRMPTDAEWKELQDRCTWNWITYNGINGVLGTSEENDHSIFLPSAGCWNVANFYNAGSEGYYWSSSRSSYSEYANFVMVQSARPIIYISSINRYFGLSVRPVTE